MIIFAVVAGFVCCSVANMDILLLNVLIYFDFIRDTPEFQDLMPGMNEVLDLFQSGCLLKRD